MEKWLIHQELILYTINHKIENGKPEENEKSIVKVLAGESCTFVVLSNGIQPGMLNNGLTNIKLRL